MTGYRIANRYLAGDVIGCGRMSEVHRGRDLRLDRDVAIKVLRADLARDPSFQARFRREARNAATLNHPNIMAVHDTGDGVDRATGCTVPFIVMELVDGDTLQHLLAGSGPLPTARALEIGADICAALDFSHRQGLVHRDVTPANVMIDRTGAVKVTDFGIARANDGQAITTATEVIGSAQYLSPEQCRGETGDARSDLYATGCVLYEMLCGTTPFTGRSPIAVAQRHVLEAPRPPSEIRRGLPRDVDAVVLRALSKNPQNRHQTAGEMRRDLARALAGQRLQAAPLLRGAELPGSPRTAPTGARVDERGLGGGASSARGGPLLLAPVMTLPPDPAEGPTEHTDSERIRRMWRTAGIGALCLSVVVALTLTIMVITTPPPPPKVAVPDLSGMGLGQAVATLQDKHLTLGTVTKIDSPESSGGKIVNQRPSDKTQVSQDTPVDVEIDTS